MHALSHILREENIVIIGVICERLQLLFYIDVKNRIFKQNNSKVYDFL